MEYLVNSDRVIEFTSNDIFDEISIGSHGIDYKKFNGSDTVEYVIDICADIDNVRIHARGSWREENNGNFPSSESMENLFFLVQNNIKRYISEAVSEKAIREATDCQSATNESTPLNLSITSIIKP